MLTLWRPFGGLFGLSRELDDVFWGKPSNGNRVDFAPAVDIEEKADHFLVSADLPGVSEKDIEVKVQDGVLLLSGKRESKKEEKTEGGYYRERSYGSFCRSFTLGDGVDPAKIEAAYKNGVLTVKLPKKAETQPRQIPVSTN
jgi:HSP20 family protein